MPADANTKADGAATAEAPAAAAPAFQFNPKPFVEPYAPYSGSEGSIEHLVKAMCEAKK
eukprot:CAMPEP_0174851960 /NCGR_PEP_ID=MMETSP1114-20130205/24660_1 /TAXON_ID=312471 /ORGANISM="Neobodo designis, Strain CCAP 1951/1" /LENGTH=58 /DNA_ID=CAMNT_0016086527 /DNA_START=31 /DNA_END=207 /DNA_ORIENTATION=+